MMPFHKALTGVVLLLVVAMFASDADAGRFCRSRHRACEPRCAVRDYECIECPNPHYFCASCNSSKWTLDPNGCCQACMAWAFYNTSCGINVEKCPRPCRQTVEGRKYPMHVRKNMSDNKHHWTSWQGGGEEIHAFFSEAYYQYFLNYEVVNARMVYKGNPTKTWQLASLDEIMDNKAELKGMEYLNQP